MRRCSATVGESSRLVVISPLQSSCGRVGRSATPVSPSRPRSTGPRTRPVLGCSRLSGTKRGGGTIRAGPSAGGAADATDSGQRRFRRVDQWHRPHAGRTGPGQRDTTPTTHVGAQRYRPGTDAQRRPFGKFFLSSGEAVAALGPARLQDGATGPRAHPVPKPVLLGPTTVARLKCSLHGRLLDSAPKHQCRGHREPPMTGLQRRALYRQESVFFACGKPATVMSPSPSPSDHPHPVDNAVDG